MVGRWRKYLVWAARRHPVWFRLRDLLLTRTGDPGRFWTEDAGRWNPVVPPAYQQAAAQLSVGGPGGDWERAVAIALDLRSHRGRLNGLSTDSLRALEGVRAGAGNCSDRTQVFLGLCLASNIRVREWAYNVDGNGHAFCEVFCPERDRWQVIDPFHGVQVVDPHGPVGVLDLLAATGGERAALRVERLPGSSPDPIVPDSTFSLRADTAFRLIARNQMFAQDALLRFEPRCPLVLLHAALVLSGRYQRFWSYTPDQAAAIQAEHPHQLPQRS